MYTGLYVMGRLIKLLVLGLLVDRARYIYSGGQGAGAQENRGRENGDKRTGKGGKQKRKVREARGLRSWNHFLSVKILSKARTQTFL